MAEIDKREIFIAAVYAERKNAWRRQIDECPEELRALAEMCFTGSEDREALEARISQLRSQLWSFDKGSRDYISYQTAINIGVLRAINEFKVTHKEIDKIFESADATFRKQNPKHKSNNNLA